MDARGGRMPPSACALSIRLKDVDLESEEAESFARFDVDGDGIISLADLQAVSGRTDLERALRCF